jgi:hypothetical protein
MSGSAALAAVAAANAVAAPTIQQGLAATGQGGLQLGQSTSGLQLGMTSGLGMLGVICMYIPYFPICKLYKKFTGWLVAV